MEKRDPEARRRPSHLPVERRKANFEEVCQVFSEAEAVAEASRCLLCPKQACVVACPLHNDIPSAMSLIAEGKFIDAARVVLAAPRDEGPERRHLSRRERVFEEGNIGHRPSTKGGYFPVPPVDSLQDIRSAMCLALAGGAFRPLARDVLGIGLVSVIEGNCQGCNMKLPPQLYNVLQRGNSIEQCPSCLRIIFWDHLLGEQEPAAPDQKGVEATP